MMRLTPPGYRRLAQAHHLEVTFGGAEANTAVLLAQLGHETRLVTALPPNNELAEACARELRGFGVDTGAIRWEGDRLGLYFYEHGTGCRPGKVVYDRAGSAFSQLTEGGFDWDRLLAGAGWFHCTGITPALSPALASESIRAIRCAAHFGVPVSFDPNYRSKLWTREAARAVLPDLADGLTLLALGVEDATTLYGAPQHLADDEPALCEWLSGTYSLRNVLLQRRRASRGGETSYGAALWSDGNWYESPWHEITAIVDRLGTGDAVLAGMVAALIEKQPGSEAICFAAACGAYAHTISGDFAHVTRAELAAVAHGETAGRVQR
jgi:2-dehydro-3-deoxygluconokinase